MSEVDTTQAGQVNRSAAEVYEEFFVPALFGQWAPTLLDVAGVTAGDDVLDVGCGTGIVARVAVGRLDGTGSVHGADINDGMLDVARRVAPSVKWQQAPAEALPFTDASFDRTISQFALMFFADRRAALTEMVRVTRPGGSITIATWAGLDQSPGYAAMTDLLRRLFGEPAAAALAAPFVLGTEEALDAVVGPALPDPRITRHEGVARFESIEAWVHTDVRGWTLSNLIDDDQYAALLAAATIELAEFVDSDGRVCFDAPALIASATL